MSFVKRVLLLLSVAAAAAGTALDDYVWKEDENYGWVNMGEDYILKGGFGDRTWTGYTLNVTSQRWLTDADFTEDSQAKSIWWHYLVVIVPDEIKYTANATMYITGGSMGMGPPQPSDEDIGVSAALAASSGVITGTLFQIPNEHVTFSADPILKSRSEDAVIAFTWDHFLKDSTQPEWLLRFPMVKASLRAMDAMTEFVKKELPELGCNLDYYTVAGASKRGWTTWDVGAVDGERVQAIVPIVLDAINFRDVEHHQYRSYGGWTWALKDYTDENITARFDDPNMELLQENVDPFFYKDRLTMPKLVVNAMLDEFQQPDDTHYWWSEMPEPKHFILTPNAEHSCATGILMIVPAVGAWIQNLLASQTASSAAATAAAAAGAAASPLTAVAQDGSSYDPYAIPTFSWEISDKTGEITVTLDNNGVVHEAAVWYGYSCGVNVDGVSDAKLSPDAHIVDTPSGRGNGVMRRDFRILNLDSPCTCGIEYDGYCANIKSLMGKEKLEMQMVRGKRTYSAKFDAPKDGRYVAFLIDIKYENAHPFAFSIEELQSKVAVTTAASDSDAESSTSSYRSTKQRIMAELRDQIKDLASGKKPFGDGDRFGGLPTDFGHFLEFTTEVSVWPNTFPYEDCEGSTCGDLLV